MGKAEEAQEIVHFSCQFSRMSEILPTSLTVSPQRSPNLSHCNPGDLPKYRLSGPALGDSVAGPQDCIFIMCPRRLGSLIDVKAAATQAPSSTEPEDKHVLRALWNPAVLICGGLAEFLALDYPTKLSQDGF